MEGGREGGRERERGDRGREREEASLVSCIQDFFYEISDASPIIVM